MNRKERRLLKRKKKAIRKILKNTYLDLVKIKNTGLNEYTKRALCYNTVAASGIQIDTIRHFSYIDINFETGGIIHGKV